LSGSAEKHGLRRQGATKIGVLAALAAQREAQACQLEATLKALGVGNFDKSRQLLEYNAKA
jgi:hypothetical protein